MTDPESEISHLVSLHRGLRRLGPGDDASTLRAWAACQPRPAVPQVLDLDGLIDGVYLPYNAFPMVTRSFLDVRVYDTYWMPLHREMQFLKRDPSTDLLLRWNDSFGFNDPSTAQGGAGYIRVLIDGTPRFTWRLHTPLSTGWTIWSETLTYLLRAAEIAPGMHTFQAFAMVEAPNGSEILNGWGEGAQENFIWFEEVPATRCARAIPTGSYNTTSTSYVDATNRSITFTKASAATRVRLTWSDTYGSDALTPGTSCSFRLVNGSGTQVGRIQHHHNQSETGWRLWPHTTQWDLTDLPAGANTLRIQYARTANSANCNVGWDGTAQILVEEIATGDTTRAITKNMPDSRPGSATAWTDVTGRAVTFTKQSSTSNLLVTWSDSFGHAQASNGPACLWRLVRNIAGTDTVVGGVQHSHNNSAGNWRIWTGTHSWLLQGLGSSTATYRVQVQRQASSSDCLSGWSDGQQENFLEIREIP